MLLHKDIPYDIVERTTWNGINIKEYNCKYFNFSPYNCISFSTKTEEAMQSKIDYFLDNKDELQAHRDLLDVGMIAYYADKTTGDYTGD